MSITQKRISAIALSGAGVFFARESIAWAIGEIWSWIAELFVEDGPVLSIPSPFPWIDALGMFLLTIGLGIFLLSLRNDHKETASESSQHGSNSNSKSQFPRGIYVGSINIDLQHLEDDLYLEIAILIYNGSGETITIDEIRGTIALYEWKDGRQLSKIDLPQAMLVADRGSVRNIDNMQESLIMVNQRVPRVVAQRIHSVLNNGSRIELDFDDWSIIARVVGEPNRSNRLQLWNGAMLSRSPERIFIGKVVKASVDLRAGASGLGSLQ